MLTSGLLFSSQVQQNSVAAFLPQTLPTIFFSHSFPPCGLDTMWIYFQGGTFPPDFRSLHPSNRAATWICQESELGLTPFSAFLGKGFLFCCLFQPFQVFFCLCSQSLNDSLRFIFPAVIFSFIAIKLLVWIFHCINK